MPIYEYRCQDCGKISSFLTLSVSQTIEPICARCGSSRMKKLVSRVAVFRSEESRLENLADPAKFGDLDENDPRSLAKWMKKMGRQLGEDLDEDFESEIDQALEEAEKAKERSEESEDSSEDESPSDF
ncbi:MAG: zinc ribbon domain-containing protein [Candidatus Aminicenantes bacterium]|nr:zinc ribbon domain-containing protein [Candidatus Aminicenantes bacterium]